MSNRSKPRDCYRYRCYFALRVSGRVTSTIISSVKPIDDIDLRKKFWVYYNSEVFELLSIEPLPMARKGVATLRRNDGSVKQLVNFNLKK